MKGERVVRTRVVKAGGAGETDRSGWERMVGARMVTLSFVNKLSVYHSHTF